MWWLMAIVSAAFVFFCDSDGKVLQTFSVINNLLRSHLAHQLHVTKGSKCGIKCVVFGARYTVIRKKDPYYY